MLQADYISFDTAKLAKKAGYTGNTDRIYDRNGVMLIGSVNDDPRNRRCIPCPTAASLARWVYMNMNMYVEVRIMFLTNMPPDRYMPYLYDLDYMGMLPRDTSEPWYFASPDEALEYGLVKAMKYVMCKKKV